MVEMVGPSFPGSDAAAAGSVEERFELACGPSTTAEMDSLPTRQCLAAAAVLPVDAAGISLLLGSNRFPLAATSNDATVAERLQFTLGEGPCLHAHAAGQPVLVPDVSDPASTAWSTWPIYAAQLRSRHLFAAVFAFPLTAAHKGLGTLNLYRYRPGKLTAAELDAAAAVADRVSDDMAASGMFGHGTGPAFRWLTAALPLARTRVWQAVNEVTVALEIAPADALALLRSYSYAHDQMLDDLCADVTEHRFRLDRLQL